MSQIQFMQSYYDSLQRTLQSQLERAAAGYLTSGLSLFFQESEKDTEGSTLCIEPPIGNLATSVELMLKVLAVSKSPLLLFKGLPLEVRALFASQGAISTREYSWRPHDVKLRSFEYKTLELTELIEVFNLFFPEYKQSLQPYFSFLSAVRNRSIHSALPDFETYELQRTAYLALNVFEIFLKSGVFLNVQGGGQVIEGSVLTPVGRIPLIKGREFLSAFAEERVERVRKKIEEAKRKAQHIPEHYAVARLVSWQTYLTKCPICSCEGVLSGDSDIDVDWDVSDGESVGNPYLLFLASAFECHQCGLKLDDVEELKLARMQERYVRQPSDLDKWVSVTIDESFIDELASMD